jgi:hypothetical protein
VPRSIILIVLPLLALGFEQEERRSFYKPLSDQTPSEHAEVT